MHPRLFLVTPASYELEAFLPALESAFSGGDIATLLIAGNGLEESALQRIATRVVPLAQKSDVAVLIENSTRVAGRVHADGVHCTARIEDVKLAVESFSPRLIVGAGAIFSRHEAMELAETGIDYVFFGRIDREDTPEAHRKTLEFSAWWANLFEVPCVAFAGSDMTSVKECAATGAEFVAVRDVVWQHPEGPAAGVREANAILAGFELSEAEG
ncbi:thiamine phosphate synthase [Stappia sp. GBMRC 2046]|uniref:Thiamine phosphate synthase n=1 Tax=Stappia sediminis TaxID=2692190 RepID=A0A7X3LUK9_9HYPH|nr:thiamine phosphate synthase [Stappia sediminis]MXN65379.1 thiamine phosphate synthase [Stappia sediminis]